MLARGCRVSTRRKTAPVEYLTKHVRGAVLLALGQEPGAGARLARQLLGNIPGQGRLDVAHAVPESDGVDAGQKPCEYTAGRDAEKLRPRPDPVFLLVRLVALCHESRGGRGVHKSYAEGRGLPTGRNNPLLLFLVLGTGD